MAKSLHYHLQWCTSATLKWSVWIKLHSMVALVYCTVPNYNFAPSPKIKSGFVWAENGQMPTIYTVLYNNSGAGCVVVRFYFVFWRWYCIICGGILQFAAIFWRLHQHFIICDVGKGGRPPSPPLHFANWSHLCATHNATHNAISEFFLHNWNA